ncbi:MAG: Ferredoxin [Brockia lithotrophica]|uniref:Ferredoxin n=1 Tax=Brockia lithotrophica TaxID=933949 RepID=A0A2T5G4N4_9BACL|nr:4Fe-4S binding protein [Brockia lithotrophica]MBT9253283.1 4Fe-4S binding protein [Brockia lithotrophica]PTQ51138.1 MAG: Ferredoxin [Brockia lithotrophica]
MAYVITSACIGAKHAECVDVCPVDAIHPRPGTPEFEQEEMLYIDPDVCIDCGACEAVCPVNAIYHEDFVPEEEKEFIERNRAYFAK